MEQTPFDISPELNEKIQRLMGYLSKAKDNGELQIFSSLFTLDYEIIGYLYHHPNAHPSEMADFLKVTRPNIAANLRVLESKDFLERLIDEKNRRQVYVNLTDKGRTYYEVCQKQLAYLFSGWFAILGPEEVEHLFTILDKSCRPELMTDNLKNFSFGD
jgi:DNA-binding MarR family transcriptional regulator